MLSIISRRVVLAKGLLVSRSQPVRMLNVHEYIASDLLKSHGVNTPVGQVASSPEEAEQVFNEVLGGKPCVIKAQVLSGGRGLGTFKNGFKGGVHSVSSAADVKKMAGNMLGQRLVTKQSGANGILCNKVLLVERLNLRREMYLSITMDRKTAGPVIVASPVGGTSIEDVAASTPDKIFKEPVDIMEGVTDDIAGRVSTNLGFETGSKAHQAGAELLKKVYKVMTTTDATLVEINPLAETNDGRVMAADAKVNFDDNAEFRQKEMFAKRDYSQEDPREVEAHKYELNYIGLTGNIGCMVNGAGLAMSTMDLIKLKGGEPANFLDVGGGANETQVTKAFEILNNDRQVKCILVNIFGGIMRCDVIAAGMLNAAKNLGMKKPIIIRLQGTNVEQARELIASSSFKMIVENDLEAAAKQAVAVANIMKLAEEAKLDVDVKTSQ